MYSRRSRSVFKIFFSLLVWQSPGGSEFAPCCCKRLRNPFVMGVGRVVGLVARHRPMLLLLVAPFVLCCPLAASFCCPEGEIGGRKEPGRKCRFWPSVVACGLPSPAFKKLVVATVGGLVDVGLWAMVRCGYGWMGVGTVLLARSLLILLEGCDRVVLRWGAIC